MMMTKRNRFDENQNFGKNKKDTLTLSDLTDVTNDCTRYSDSNKGLLNKPVALTKSITLKNCMTPRARVNSIDKNKRDLYQIKSRVLKKIRFITRIKKQSLESITAERNKENTKLIKHENDENGDDIVPSFTDQELEDNIGYLDEVQRFTASDPGCTISEACTFSQKFQTETMLSLKDFEYIQDLGEGAYGKVFLARRTLTGDLYAIKVLDMKKDIDKKELKNIMNERDVFSLLNSPFCVNALASFIFRSSICFVIEYVPGRDLFH